MKIIIIILSIFLISELMLTTFYGYHQYVLNTRNNYELKGAVIYIVVGDDAYAITKSITYE